jgi:hypothetical protein
MEEVRSEVEDMVWRFHAANSAMDAATIVGLLWPEYEMLVDGQRLDFHQVAEGARSSIAGLREIHAEWSDLKVVPLSGDWAVASFIFHDSVVTASGEVIQSRGPTTLVWERRGDEWRMRLGDADHYSLPP